MARRNKNIKTGFPGFMKYRENNLSGREKNAFEKELQKDPFAEEAEEGFSALDTDQLKKDMDILSGRLKKRTAGDRRITYYRIAASVAVMAGLFTVYLLLHRPKEPEAKTAGEPEAFIINRPAPITANKIEEHGREKITFSEKKKEVVSNVSEAETGLKTAENLKQKKESDTTVSEHLVVSEAVVTAVRDSAPPVPQLSRQADDKPVSQEINARAAERSIAGGISKADYKKEAVTVDHFPPEPSNGKERFDNYIRSNIRNPEILKNGKSEIVVLSFLVRTTGIIDSIKVVKSPGQVFSDEAVRLLKEGPKWKPATENGNPIEEEARVRIVFK